MSDLQVQVVTPESLKFEGQARRVQLPGVMGTMGVLPQHAPLVTMLEPGVVEVIAPSGNKVFAVGPGFATIANNQVVCLVDDAAEASEIDSSKVAQRIQELESRLVAEEDALLRSELAFLKAQLYVKG